MSVLDKAVETQLKNIESKAGQPLATLVKAIKASGLAKHGEMRTFAQEKWGLGHGDANALVHHAMKSDGASAAKAAAASGADPLDEIYAEKKAHLRPIHDALMGAIAKFGDFEVAPKKGYVALRRKKQFAMLGPKTNDRFELGINLKGEAAHPLVKAQPPGGMCQYVAALVDAKQIDAALIKILRAAYDASA
jgi:hypothetical protein